MVNFSRWSRKDLPGVRAQEASFFGNREATGDFRYLPVMTVRG